MKSQLGYEFLKQTFAYDPDKRLTACDALQHKWFLEEPIPTAKLAIIMPCYHKRLTKKCVSAFQSLTTHHIPPQRRITQDDAPSMMPLATANSHAQAAAQIQAQAAAQLSQLSHSQSHSAKGSAGSFSSTGAARKKPRLC
jgi:cyclin-dependent kinase 8/11